MSIDILKERGIPVKKQEFSWKDLAPPPYNKIDDDAFTRVRVILMNGIESESVRFSHACARVNASLQNDLALVRRSEQHQQTMVNWLNPADQSPIETTIGFEQVAIEVTAALAEVEPDAYIASILRFGLLEDFDHMYRFAALYDRLEGGDANVFLQSYTDILPGRPTSVEHRHPQDDLRTPYDKSAAAPLTKIHALLITAAENQTHDYYMTIGPMFSDPLARQLYAEIASIEEQHTTQYESLCDPSESWLEKWALHETVECYAYYSCWLSEENPRIKKIWERMLDCELGHLHHVGALLEQHEGRELAELVPATLPAPMMFKSNRDFVREVLRSEVHLRAIGTDITTKDSGATKRYRAAVNADGSPSDLIAASYVFSPGTEQAEELLKSSLDSEDAAAAAGSAP